MRTHSEDVPVEPNAALAANTLANKSANEMIKKLSEHLATSVPKQVKQANEPNKNKDQSVEAGREYVDAYGGYLHYGEDIHTAILSTSGHQQADENA